MRTCHSEAQNGREKLSGSTPPPAPLLAARCTTAGQVGGPPLSVCVRLVQSWSQSDLTGQPARAELAEQAEKPGSSRSPTRASTICRPAFSFLLQRRNTSPAAEGDAGVRVKLVAGFHYYNTVLRLSKVEACVSSYFST